MSDYREVHEQAREFGVARRNETRHERAIREDPMKALRYLLAQYDRIVEVHEHVVMDTPEDRELHDRAIATFKEAAEPIRKMLASESGHLTVDVIGPAFPCPPGCAHWSHEEGADLS